MRTTTKINRHEKIASILKCGKPVSPQEIAEVFKGTDQESVLYRLSTNIYNIRKDGGVIKVFKDGRNVTAYQLVNIDEFNKDGRYVGRQPKTIEQDQTPEIVTRETETV
jgi:asparagine N-glycosylation enzyme membrane subunit Stt3